MSIETIKEGGIVTEQVSRLLQTGETQKALELMEQKFGPRARALMEDALKHRNLTLDELARTLSKVSDILENAAVKIAKLEQVEDKKNVEAAERKFKEEAARAMEAQIQAAENQKKMEERLKAIEEIKRQIKDKDEEKEKLEHERHTLAQKEDSKEKRKKLKEIDEKIKQLDKRKKELAEKREKIEKALQEMQNKKAGKEQEKTDDKTKKIPLAATIYNSYNSRGNNRS